jgi:hypothetical protein
MPALASCVFVLLLAQAPADSAAPVVVESAVDPVLRLGERLAALRASVDTLAADVTRERAALHDEVTALERRRRELEERVALSTLTAREFEARAEATRAAFARTTADLSTSQAPVRDAIARLRRVQARVPFRLHARRERLAALERGLDGMTSAMAAAALWPIIVDEARAMKERGRVRQAITVDGVPVMAELVHVGPLVWWRAADGRGGVASLEVSDEGPRFVVVDDAESRQRLTLFFEALRRGTPTGDFLVPSPLLTPAAIGATP